MQIDQIIGFVRCVEFGSLSAASRAVGLPKSSLSRQLGALEQELGVELLSRTSRGLVLTEEGRVFLDHARQILDSVASATAAVRHTAEAPSGTIRITAPYTFGATFLAPLLPAFFRAYPLINVHVELSSRNIDYGAEGFDAGIRIGTPPPDVVARSIMRNPIMLCATPSYLARRGTPATPDDLASHTLLLIGNPRSTNVLRLMRDGGVTVVGTPPQLVSTDPVMVLRSTLADVGVGQVPVILARAEIASGDLVRVLPDWTMHETEISIIYPCARPLPPRVRVFVDFICQALQPQP